ncbi:MAG: hypothetical protein BWX45_01218 [Deltaproteobacteria bacterium ADurb.Bin002]|jgi:hypothetical protein|nr:MAG: hypothetical protein BWX45_01218 [Deltaproteobacteria bacterium ADurb.Bin002]
MRFYIGEEMLQMNQVNQIKEFQKEEYAEEYQCSYVSVNSTPLSVIKHHNGEQIFSVWQILAMFRQNKVKELRFIL